MTAFGGVRSVGIYCRPGCGGLKDFPPEAERYPSAAAAEAAGLRACACCRPYRAAHPACTGSEELVCRGIRLIMDGALDGHTEEELAAQLAVSSRHLRRLFVEHAGVTPDGLARSARAHFARRLLDDTDLSMTDVAFAAGYTSLRQFNRACREVFGATPRALRAKRRDSDRLVADGGILLRLPFDGPLDWRATVEYLAERAIPGVEHVEGDVYRRTIVSAGDPGVIEVMPGDDEHLLLRAHLPHLADLLNVVRRARHVAQLDFPIDDAACALARIPSLAPSIEARPGVRPPGAWDPFEAGVHAILAQRSSLPAATAAAGRIVERYGTPVPGLDQLGLTHTFPSPAVLTEADGADLRAFARAVETHEICLDRSMSLDALIGAVTSLCGVGRSTAHYLALRIGEPDAWPIPEASQGLESLGARARPWRALAATHLLAASAYSGRTAAA